MRALILRPLSILALLLLAWCAAHVSLQRTAQVELQGAHGHPVVVFGDSHAGDVRLPDVPRFASPAQDLVSTWMWMDAFARAGSADSKVKAVVLTIWPSKFGPVAERRLSGRLQKDSWGQSVLGRVAPVLGMRHVFDGAVPWRLRWRMVLNVFQFRQSILAKGWVCQDQSIGPDYAFRMGIMVKESPWFQEATVSRWAFDQIVQLAEREQWELVLLEHPLHESFLSQVNPDAMAAYQAALTAAADHPRITYVDMAEVALPPSAFRDYHHLTCSGSAVVSARLDPLLQGWGIVP